MLFEGFETFAARTGVLRRLVAGRAVAPAVPVSNDGLRYAVAASDPAATPAPAMNLRRSTVPPSTENVASSSELGIELEESSWGMVIT